MKKRLIAGALAFALLAGLCGCSGQIGDKQAKQRIDTAIEKLDGIKSVENTIHSNMDIVVMGEKMELKMTGEYARFYQPLKMKMIMEMEYEGQPDGGYQIYMEEDDGMLTVYRNLGDGWEKQSGDMGGSSTMKEYDLKAELESTYSSLEGYEEMGEELIDGRKCVKIRARMNKEESLKMFNSVGIFDTVLQQNGMNLDADKLTKGMQPLEIYTWIDSEKGYIVQYRLDMTQAARVIYTNLFEQMGLTAEEGALEVNEVSVDMRFRSFDEATDFSIPDEALNAPKGNFVN